MLVNSKASQIAKNQNMFATIESLKLQVNILVGRYMHGVPNSPTSINEESSKDEEFVERIP